MREPRDRLDDGCVRSRPTFRPGAGSTHDHLRLDAEYLRGPGAGPRPLVVVVPICGNGAYRYASARFTEHVRREGEVRFDILHVHGDPPLIRWDHLAGASTPEAFRRPGDTMAQRVSRAVITIRRMHDWAQRRPDIDTEAVSIVGFSMGAIVATLVLGAEDRLAARAVVMGGARLARILARCDRRAGQLRATITARFGWTTAEYRQVSTAAFAHGQPGPMRGRYDPEHLLMMDAAFDDCIPRSARRSLWHTLGRPERVRFLARHRGALLASHRWRSITAAAGSFYFVREQVE